MAAARNPQDILFHQVLAEFKQMTGEIAGLRIEMENFKETLEPINRIVRGDGVIKSIPTQVELLQQELGHLSREVASNKTRLKETEDKVSRIDSDDKKGKWTVIAAITSGSLALIGSIIAMIVASLRK